MATDWISRMLNAGKGGAGGAARTNATGSVRPSTAPKANSNTARLTALSKYYQNKGSSQGVAAVRRIDTPMTQRQYGVQDVRKYEMDYQKQLDTEKKRLDEISYQKFLKERQTNMLNWLNALQAMYPGYKINLAGRGGWDTTLTPPTPTNSGGGGYGPQYGYGGGGGGGGSNLPDWYMRLVNWNIPQNQGG